MAAQKPMALNAKFNQEYNNLDKILREMYPQREQGISGVYYYLLDMEHKKYQGLRLVPSWETDYRTLNDLRRKRNHLTHEGDYQSACFSEEDIEWIVWFRKRVMTRQDPLSLLYIQEKYSGKPAKPEEQKAPVSRKSKEETKSYVPVGAAVVFCIIFIALVIVNLFQR